MLGPLAHLFGARVMHRQQLAAPVWRDGGMVWLGDNSIEIGAPYGGDSPVSAFVERFGGGMHSVALQVADMAATLRRLEPLGVEVATRIAPDIVFTRPNATAGLLLEWGSHVQEDDPRFGAAPLPFTEPPVIAVDRMAFVGAVVADPVLDGRRLAGRARHRPGRLRRRPRARRAPDRAHSRRLHARAVPAPARRGHESLRSGAPATRGRDASRSPCRSSTNGSPNRARSRGRRSSTTATPTTGRCWSRGCPSPSSSPKRCCRAIHAHARADQEEA